MDEGPLETQDPPRAEMCGIGLMERCGGQDSDWGHASQQSQGVGRKRTESNGNQVCGDKMDKRRKGRGLAWAEGHWVVLRSQGSGGLWSVQVGVLWLGCCCSLHTDLFVWEEVEGGGGGVTRALTQRGPPAVRTVIEKPCGDGTSRS
uniref:Uncharacterized protein n=1 Tax=Knipowitschia caucasica TaxID=637954 RepID=A0AAV2MQ20_KNICA